MAFKIKPPYIIDNTPLYHLDFEEDGLLGRADKNGSILINKNITDPKQKASVIRHEKVHLLSLIHI